MSTYDEKLLYKALDGAGTNLALFGPGLRSDAFRTGIERMGWMLIKWGHVMNDETGESDEGFFVMQYDYGITEKIASTEVWLWLHDFHPQ